MKPSRVLLFVSVASLILSACNQPTQTKTSSSADPDGGIETAESEKKEKEEFEKANKEAAEKAEKLETAKYKVYSEEAVTSAQKADKNFKANPEKIPENVVVLKTDYDDEKALREKYSVTYQHTFVQIDKDGKMITTWNSGDIEELKKRIK